MGSGLLATILQRAAGRARGIVLLAAASSAACAAKPLAPEVTEVRIPTNPPPSFAEAPNPEIADIPLPERLRASMYYKLEQDTGGATVWLRRAASLGGEADVKQALRELSTDDPASVATPLRLAGRLGGAPAESFELQLPGGGFGLFAQSRGEPSRLVELGGSGVGDAERAALVATIESFHESTGALKQPPPRTRWHRVGGYTFAADPALRLTQARFVAKHDEVVVTVSPSCAAQAASFLTSQGHSPEEPERTALGEPRDEQRTLGGASTRLVWATTTGPEGKRLLRLAASRVGIECLLVVYKGSLEPGAGVLTDEEWLAVAAAVRGAAEAP